MRYLCLFLLIVFLYGCGGYEETEILEVRESPNLEIVVQSKESGRRKIIQRKLGEVGDIYSEYWY